MCGIVGFNFKNSQILHSMLTSIKHRGPDDSGVYESDELSLGHVRLSILDLSEHGHQPMSFEHLVMVYNGEVYNFKEIKDELKSHGYSFISHSDTEVILKAFHKWGLKAIDIFIGMFAIALFDKLDKKLYLIRDRVGVKPLYYFFDGKEFIFASEVKSILVYKKSLAISKEALSEYFRFGYISLNLSIFKNCYKVPPASYLEFDVQKKSIKIQEYWSILPFFEMPKFTKDENKLTDELEEILVSAFKYRMVSDVPVGVFLSGGIDSSIVSAILQKHVGDIHTFTIGFKESKYDESKYAKKIANFLGTNHIEKILSVYEAQEILKNFVDIYDEPFGDSSGIPTYLVSKVAKENGVKVVLSADGGDEIFCGYDRYWISFNLGKKLFRLPKSLRYFGSFIIESFQLAKLLRLKSNRYARRAEVLQNLLKKDSWQDLYEGFIEIFKKEELKRLLGIEIFYDKLRPFEIGAKIHPMQGMMLWDYHRYMVDDILVKVDRSTMANSIEGREPLLDHRIAEFMAQVPFELKYKDGTSKYLLKRVLSKYIPKDLFERPKMGFGIPMYEWFSGELKKLFEIYLTKEQFDRHGLFDFRYLKQNYLDKSDNDVIRLWSLLVFEMWYERYLEANKTNKHY